ncbi:MAG: TRAP transporter small permease [Clostridia bacterium]|nr:TRAP transporter small permease [Clostridia bacterium]
MKVIKWLDDHLEEFLLIVALVLITLVSFVQVIIRKVPWIPSLQWAEEFCRFMWIWSVFLSLPYTIRRGSMLRVTVAIDLLPEKGRKVINLLVDIINIAVMCVLLYHCLVGSKAVFIKNIRKIELSPAMLWPMWTIYLSLPVGFFLGVVRGVQILVEHIKNFNVHQLTALEQTVADAAEEVATAQNAEAEKKEA